jgi:putative ABC transport system permease protein
MSIWPLFSRRRRDQELDEEIQAHLAMATRERTERGEDPQAAELAARREFGNRTLIQETTREMWRWNSLETVWQDARYAFRGMRRSPGFTAVAVVSLALGIGANTAIFSLANAVMWRMLPVQHPEQLVELLQKYPGETRGLVAWSSQSCAHYRDHNHVFAALTGFSVDTQLGVRTGTAEPETVIGESVDGNYFQTLGLKPALGRSIGPEDVSTGEVAVISWSFWKTRFHLDPAILGQRIVVSDRPVTIIGVAPREFIGVLVGSKPEVWLPRTSADPVTFLFGRVRPGVKIEQVRAEMSVLYRHTLEEMVRNNKDPLVRQTSLEVEPAGTGLARMRDRFAKPLLILMAVAGLLLLIACVNLASMLLARAAVRQREMAVRVGLGASRIRLVRQVLTESLLLSAAGTLLGVLFAHFTTGVLVGIIASGREHERWVLQVQPDFHMLLFAAGVAMLTGLCFGTAPALHAFRSESASALRQTGAGGETRLRRLFGRGLVAAQVAISVLLLSAAGLFVGHLSHLKNLNLGFHRDHVLLVTLDPARGGYKRAQLSHPYRELLARLESIPGVRSATIGGCTPIQGCGAGRFVTAEGYQERPEDRRRISLSWVAPKYFKTLGTPLLAGRDFGFEDEGRSRVAIINQTMARYFFGGASPIGKYISFDGDTKPYEVVGVVGDAKYWEIRERPPLMMYLNMFQEGKFFTQFVLRSDVEPTSVVGEMRRTVGESLKTVPITRVITLAEQVDASIVPERLVATLSGLFGALGLLIVAIGLYGLLSYMVTRRTNEIGIRMALGAAPGDVSRMVLGEALGTVGAGLMIGVPIALWGKCHATRVLEGLPVDSTVPIIFGTLGMVAVALLAAYVPAHRATRVDPMTTLRHE